MRSPIIPPTSTVQPSGDRPMSMGAVAFHDRERTRKLAAMLEERVARRVGSLETARPIVAREVGTLPGTLESLRRGRLKKIEGWFRDRITALLVKEIGAEIKRLTHEHQMVRQCYGSAYSGDLAQIDADIATLKALIATPSTEGA